MRKYNYVIFGSSWDLYKHSYADIIGLEDVVYISDMLFKSNIIRRIHLGRINNIFSLPFKSIWNSSFFKREFCNEKPICFIFTSVWPNIAEKTSFLTYLKKQYRGSKVVLFLQDLYKFVRVDYTKYDLSLSFDYGDSEKYGFIYHPLVFSKINLKSGTGGSLYDIYFLGKAKNRLDEIIKAYEILNTAGLSLDFNIVGTKKEEQIYPEKINYIEMIPYEDNLHHILSSKCVLEIMQKGGLGFTQRTVECVGLNRKLLTNNPMITRAPFYNPNYISQFITVEDINKDFLNKLKGNEAVDYKYKDNLSPIELLSFIDSKL